MTGTFIITALFLVLSGLGYYIFEKKAGAPEHGKYGIWILAALAFCVRIIAAAYYPGHETDMLCFSGWADMVFKDGFSAFYTSDVFTDYPPGYMYVLYIVGFVRNVFGLTGTAASIAVKIPAIICDILCGFCVYRICPKKDIRLKLCFAAFFMLNPAVILNSAMWGQVDSVFTLIVILMLSSLTEKRLHLSYYLFAVAILIKPQALFYAPVLAYGIVEQVFLTDYSPKKLAKNLLHGISALFIAFLLALPFGIENVVTQYIGTLNSYAYASVNAYNLWSALGMNFSPLTPAVSALGYIFIIIIVAASAYMFFAKRQKNSYFLVSAFICFSVFMLSVKMHERYAFPAIALMLCAAAISGSKIEFAFFQAISALQLINTAHILFCYGTNAQFFAGYNRILMITSWASVILLALLAFYTLHKKSGAANPQDFTKPETPHLYHISGKDILIMLAITVLYAAVALFNLGNRTAPKTYELLTPENSLSADFGGEYNIASLKFYPGAVNIENTNAMTVTLSDAAKNVVFQTVVNDASVFTWYEIEDISQKARYIEISSAGELQLFEMGIINEENEIIIPESSLRIFDEYYEVPREISYRNSMYFDEIYHARTAYEFINKLPVYEWTHPPLGKVIIAIGVEIFGMTPFGWRIMGTLFGILMLPIMYIFSKKLFGSTKISACGTLVFAFDFMHFAQTRIATIDVYVTFFIMLMYMLMYDYYSSAQNRLFAGKKLVSLGLCGIFMGLGIACKWTGAYAGAGLAILFFITFFKEYGIRFYSNKQAVKTIVFCVFAFVLIPLLIYAASYIPFIRANSGGISDIFQNQADMLGYHGKTVVSSTHPFSSPWYEWIINYRPIWYYTGENSRGLCENISAFGNPLVWISGIGAFIYCLFDGIRNKNKRALFLVVGYLAQLLPWVTVTRITFIYHYFPCVPFIVLMLCHTADSLKTKKSKYIIYTFTALVIVMFAAFYPAISGYPVNGDYVRNFLKWLPSWQLIN